MLQKCLYASSEPCFVNPELSGRAEGLMGMADEYPPRTEETRGCAASTYVARKAPAARIVLAVVRTCATPRLGNIAVGTLYYMQAKIMTDVPGNNNGQGKITRLAILDRLVHCVEGLGERGYVTGSLFLSTMRYRVLLRVVLDCCGN